MKHKNIRQNEVKFYLISKHAQTDFLAISRVSDFFLFGLCFLFQGRKEKVASQNI